MLISNSEAKSFLDCERRHFYSFRKGIKPTTYSKALTRGIVGHEALEAFYKAKQKGLDAVHCVADMMDVLDKAIRETPEFSPEFEQLRLVLVRYADYYWDEPWKILEVESSHDMPILENSIAIKYGLRLDLLVEITAGRDKGQIVIVDHKFVYDFFTSRELEMNTQQVKYIKTLRANGIPVRKAILNQIRYRQLKSPKPGMLFRRSSIYTSEKEAERFLHEFKKVALEIDYLSGLTEDEHKEASKMHIDKNTCGSCAYQPLCKLYLEGIDEKRTEEMLYSHNDYIDQYKDV
jgi:hypothetical protein